VEEWKIWWNEKVRRDENIIIISELK